MPRKTKTTRKRSSRKKAQDTSMLRRWWESISLEHKAGALQVAIRVIALGLIVIAVGCGMKKLESHVRDTTSTNMNTPVRLQVATRPAWMPAELAYRIARSFAVKGAARYDDVDLTRNIAARAQANPWVRRVRSVRKARDASGRPFVRVDCEFRRPAAMVARGKEYYFVDEYGVRLRDSIRNPEVPRWTAILPAHDGEKARQEDFIEYADVPVYTKPWRIHYIIIELDERMDPPAPLPGQVWDTEALTAGLKLTALLRTRSYARDFDRVDVRNYAGRISTVAPHLSFSVGDSNFPFGRFPHVEGYHYNVSTKQKMQTLDNHAAKYGGRLAGAPGIDLQFEHNYDDRSSRQSTSR